MKKIIVPILSTAMIFTGCLSMERSMEQRVAIEAVNMESHKIMAQYNHLIEEESKPEDVILFIDNNVDYLSEENADEIMVDLFDYLSSYGDVYMDKLFKDKTQETLNKIFPNGFDESEIHHISDRRIKELLREIVNGRYKFVRFEGSYYPVVDYDYLKRYSPYVSDGIKDYFKLMGRESAKVMVKDGTLSISWDELGERLIQVETYLEKYPDSSFKKECTSLYLTYLQVYIWGMEDTQVDKENSIILEEAYNSYEKMARKYKDTNIGEMLGQYVNILDKNNRIINENIEKSRDGLYKNAISILDKEMENGQ
ncbi:MAG: hypothetical protein N4A57_18445 [Anaeromicrobium sp.]|jgi:hypothetical protein|uniref:hypothetical protein n=1 Tax=Anaeromicrobium sp. TaxID=1929132 RepID=UPI0025DA2A74|nr:hypothetical protein [Anaeromicrobium sp.]MCT4596230.1 hypothetical protein [Anaeromicrobium sp.]